MALYYITGIAGSGKSTVLSALKNRGFEAYDVDEAGPVTAKWHNNLTGFIHPKSSIKKEDRTADFIASHSWKVAPEEVMGLAKQSETRTVFLGGSVANEFELQPLFRAIFALAIDDTALKLRLAARTNNDWGKNPHELVHTLEVNRELGASYQKYGYIVIDASQTTPAVVNEILNHVDETE